MGTSWAQRVLIDMDDVLVNFQSGIDKLAPETLRQTQGALDEVPGFFGEMEPMHGHHTGSM